MKKGIGSAQLVAICVAAALIGLFLRNAQLDSGSSTALIVFSAAVCAAFAVWNLTRKQRKKYTDVLFRCLADLVLTTLGVLVLIAGCAVTAITASGAERYLAVFGVLSSLALLRAMMLRCEKQPVSALYYVPMTLYYVASLFWNFRQWTIDPAILDYCFMMFAVICYMMAAYFAASCCFDRGNRCALGFFSMAGVYFSGVSMAGGGWEIALTYGGSALILLAYVWQTSVPKRRRRRRPPVPQPDVETEHKTD